MQADHSYKGQTGQLNTRNRVEATKIIPMEQENAVLQRTFVSPGSEMEVVRHLLSDSWIKKSALVFQKPRNNYTIEVNGKDHPMWTIKVTPKSDMFSNHDWKLRQDFKRLKNLGKPIDRRLYMNENNKQEIRSLLQAMMENGFQLIYNNNYVIFRDRQQINIFKIAAKMNLVPQPDGWYAGQKKIL